MNLDIRDDRITKLLEKDCHVEQIAAGFEFVEELDWHPDEHFLPFSDITGDCIYHWSTEEGVSVFRKPVQVAKGNTYDSRGKLAHLRVCYQPGYAHQPNQIDRCSDIALPVAHKNDEYSRFLMPSHAKRASGESRRARSISL